MPILDVCGTNYDYPNVGDRPWGTEHIDWATAVSNCVTANEAQITINTGDIATNTADIAAINTDLSDKVETSSNSGAGEGLALPKVGTDLPFKSLVAGANITLTPAADSITIASTGAGAGDVVGPGSATDEAIARYDGVTGKLIQNSGVTIDDSDNIDGAANITQSGVLEQTGANLGVGVAPTANTVYPNSSVKAWGRVTITPGGGAVATLDSGFNIDTVTYNSGVLDVVFHTAMLDADYCITTCIFNSGAIASSDLVLTYVTAQSDTGFTLDGYSRDGVAGSSVAGQEIMFTVIGNQEIVA